MPIVVRAWPACRTAGLPEHMLHIDRHDLQIAKVAADVPQASTMGPTGKKADVCMFVCSLQNKFRPLPPMPPRYAQLPWHICRRGSPMSALVLSVRSCCPLAGALSLSELLDCCPWVSAFPTVQVLLLSTFSLLPISVPNRSLAGSAVGNATVSSSGWNNVVCAETLSSGEGAFSGKYALRQCPVQSSHYNVPIGAALLAWSPFLMLSGRCAEV